MASSGEDPIEPAVVAAEQMAQKLVEDINLAEIQPMNLEDVTVNVVEDVQPTTSSNVNPPSSPADQIHHVGLGWVAADSQIYVS